ncbi:C40 family peptidase [Christensenella intestinihominis]|uniref:C40 family peptidase n=1 Tax=Christensenella intestinihominis TaxID=1851429 RepID=UPI00082D8E8B|nr:peptidoglycan-binding protein [Christensenella intestinihominis]
MFKKVIAGVSVCLVVMVFAPLSALAVSRYEVLQIGDRDDWVEALQEKLHETDYLKCNPTGYFGTDTQNAVVQFQTDHGGLAVDGKAGPETRKALLGDEYEEIDSSREVDGSDSQQAESAPSSPSSAASATALNPGDKGSEVSDLQQRLKDREYYEYPSITGYYGPVTTEAVEKFQRTNNLAVTGVMDAECLSLLKSEGSKYYTMYPGDSGDDIRAMQDRLNELGYFDATSTGYFGSFTTSAVKSFQDANGLSVDGVVGKDTRRVLYSDDVKKGSGSGSSESPAESSPSGSSSSSSGNADVDRMIEIAHTQIGKPYSYGSSGPNSYDCSGFVYYCLKNSGIATSRLSSAGYSNVSRWDTITNVNSLQAGDLVYFKSDKSSSVSHIGIYLGGGSMIHSAPSSDGVAVSSMSSGYYARNFLGAKRIF